MGGDMAQAVGASEYGRISMSVRIAFSLMVAALCLSCGGSAEEPDIAVAVEPRLAMPFHGPNGPGSDTMSMTLRWAVVVSAESGGAAMVRSIHTVVRDERSGASIAADTAPVSEVSAGRPYLTEQEGSCFFPSTAYPGRWVGVTTVEIGYESGRTERIDTPFAFE